MPTIADWEIEVDKRLVVIAAQALEGKSTDYLAKHYMARLLVIEALCAAAKRIVKDYGEHDTQTTVDES